TGRNNGTLAGGAVITDDIEKGKVLFLDGSDDYAEANDSSTLDISTGITLSAWINPSSIASWNRIIAKSHTVNSAPYNMYAILLGDKNNLRMELSIGNSQKKLNGKSIIPINSWSHVAGTYDGIIMKIYVNGALDNSSAVSGGIDSNNMPLSIGRSGFGANYFSGMIDDVMVYGRALNDSEILDIYNTQKKTKCIAEENSITCANNVCGMRKNNCQNDVNCSIVNFASCISGCIQESKAVTCGSWVCGNKIDNCGQLVNCGLCQTGYTCSNGNCVVQNKIFVSTESQFNTEAARLKPGEVLVINDGTYDNWDLTITSSGTSGNPIVIRPETLHGVKFTGGSTISLEGNYIEIREFTFENNFVNGNIDIQDGKHHNRITQNYFINSGDRDTQAGIVILSPENSNNNRVDHNIWVNSQSKNLVLAASKVTKGVVSNHNRIDHNVFRDMTQFKDADGNVANGFEPVQFGQRPTNSEVFAYNIFEYNTGDNSDADGEFISIKTSGNIIRYNVIYNSFAVITLRSGSSNWIEGNVIVNSEKNGISGSGENHVIINNYISDCNEDGILIRRRSQTILSEDVFGTRYDEYEQPYNTTIAYNTVVNCEGTEINLNKATKWDRSDTLPARDSKVYNNILVGNQGTLLLDGIDSKIDTNLFYATGNAVIGTRGLNFKLENPLLTGSGIYYYPSVNSPVVDSGKNIDSQLVINKDIYGYSRPFGARADIGAHEVGHEVIKPVHIPPIPDRNPPTAPENLIVRMQDNQIILSWKPTSGDEEGFKIEGYDGNSWKQIAVVDADVLSWQDTTLIISSKYRIRAYNYDGNSPYSNEAISSPQGLSSLSIFDKILEFFKKMLGFN
ncbi:right-handed parallel beta-helix repeat-containing protein, partial [Candidatus Woesearchaeota archaeon]|nr:right-handed parallel beta-helix repeat-containing protein [Candidatus Woesearchaeota archaeon]